MEYKRPETLEEIRSNVRKENRKDSSEGMSKIGSFFAYVFIAGIFVMVFMIIVNFLSK